MEYLEVFQIFFLFYIEVISVYEKHLAFNDEVFSLKNSLAVLVIWKFELLFFEHASLKSPETSSSNEAWKNPAILHGLELSKVDHKLSNMVAVGNYNVGRFQVT